MLNVLFPYPSAVFVECVIRFHPHLVCWFGLFIILYTSHLHARVCVCVMSACVSACVCNCRFVCVSALCEKWCENASRGACVSSASNMRKICGTYLQYDTSQNDMTQPCYIWLIQPQPAEHLLTQQSSKKTGPRLKKCTVTLLKWSMWIWSKHLNVIFAVKFVSPFPPSS